jgi:WD40 repeat protein
VQKKVKFFEQPREFTYDDFEGGGESSSSEKR